MLPRDQKTAHSVESTLAMHKTLCEFPETTQECPAKEKLQEWGGSAMVFLFLLSYSSPSLTFTFNSQEKKKSSPLGSVGS